MKNTIQLSGVMHAKLIGPNGVCKQTVSKNVILNTGFDFIAAAIGSPTRPAHMSIIAVGTGTTPQVGTDVALESQLAQQDAEYSHTANTKSFMMATNFAPGVATGAITEAGVKNAADVFIDRTTFEVINKGALDSLELDFTFTMA